MSLDRQGGTRLALFLERTLLCAALAAPGTARASSGGYGALFEVDLGTVEGVRVGYDAGRLGIGARLAQGPALRLGGRLVPAAVAGVFGAIGVDSTDDPYVTLEPMVGVGVVADERINTGFALGMTVGLRFTDHDLAYRERPWVGMRLGADVIIGPGTLVLPEIGVTLSW